MNVVRLPVPARDKNNEEAFDEDAPTTVMQKEVVRELTARARVESFPSLTSLNDEPTVLAKRSAAEILAAAGQATEPSPGSQRGWNGAALVFIVAALVAASLCVLSLR